MEQALLGELGGPSLPARAALPVLGGVRPLQMLVWPSRAKPPQSVASDTKTSHHRVRT
jgi:hypothetical protein